MLSMKGKYALKAAMILARHEKKLLAIKLIAKEANIPLKFLEAILVELKQHGITESKRGIMGGYYLARPASEIMAGDIIRIIDGPLAPLRCASLTAYKPCEDCIDESACAIRHMMSEVRLAISNVLDQHSLKDMLNYPKSVADKIIE